VVIYALMFIGGIVAAVVAHSLW